MKNYTITFVGRLNGAIGIMYETTLTVSAENEESATLKLYETHDHIRVMKIVVN